MRSFTDPHVQNRFSAWLAESGVVFVEAYLPRSGGGGRFFLIRSSVDLDRLADDCHGRTLLFLGRWCPKVKTADDRLFEELKVPVSKGQEIAVGPATYFPADFDPDWPETEEELRETIEDYRGSSVLVGEAPDFPDPYWQVEETATALVARAERGRR